MAINQNTEQKQQAGGSSGASGGKESFQISAPSISLPKGGGAIRGIGEKFAANPVTGTGSMTVPIATSPGRSGFGPQLSLSYDSGAGNGPFGFGWGLSLPSITRKTDKGLPKYQDAVDSDIFILSGADDLVPTLLKDAQDHWVREPVPDRTIDNQVYRLQRYRPRIDSLFARIERWTNKNIPEDVFWRSISKDNITTWYGKTDASRIRDPNDKTRIFSWLICQTYDDKGNVIVYEYKAEDSNNVDLGQAHEKNRTDNNNIEGDEYKANRTANRYLKRICYGNRQPYLPELTPTAWPQPPDSTAATNPPSYFFEVVFDYDDGHYPQETTDAEGRVFANPVFSPPTTVKWKPRADPFSTYRAGFEVRTYRLCQRVLMFHHFPDELGTPDYLVRSTDFTYSYEKDPKDSRNPIYSFLNSVSQSGYVRQADGSYLEKSLPPLQFEYTKPEVQAEVHDVDPQSLENLPYGLDGSKYQWVDLDGEGLSGILTEQGDAWYYKRNLSPLPNKTNGKEEVAAHFGPLELVAKKPSLAALSGGGQQFLDLAGDGQLDLVALSGPTPGFFERTADEDWEPFRTFRTLPNVDWSDPHLKFVDLTGDGHADILITEDDVFWWYPSMAEDGFGPAERVPQNWDEEKGPRLVFADIENTIHLADVSGDGLSDLVRIRNGEVCYWPNLGYGRFGAKVTMDNAPWFDHPDQFDPRRIQLADIDGSGTTDIIYLGSKGVDLYFNQSGNGWSKPHHLDQYPQSDSLSSVTALDLLGNGTACLVWSSPLPGNARRPMRYLDLMGGKPHLLVKTTNNLGAETRVQYTPSTRFYVADKLAGTPWITKIPFPVHVVERVETYDYISRNRFVTRYAYHHGYFDGVEREFRGFAMVEQRDTEEIGTGPTMQVAVPDTNLDAASFVPPIVTKTWFHTGAYLDGGQLEAYFKKTEYYQGDPLAVFLPDTVLPGNLSTQEEREACRALKGAMLRQEVYAEDAPAGSPPAMIQRSKTPYTVTEQNYTIESVQPVGTNRHAVFFTHPRETISYHYERDPADPRVGHEIVLKVDGFGNVERALATGYPRRNPPADLPEQGQTHITFTINRVANRPDEDNWYRAGLPVETRTFEIIKPPQVPAGAGTLLSFENLKALTEALFPIVQVNPPATQTIPYEGWDWRSNWNPVAQPGGPGVSKLRLIEQVRTRYRPDDLGISRNDTNGLLQLGTIESLALTGETYKLAFTPGLLAQVYKRQNTFITTPANLVGAVGSDKGGYVDLDSDGHWWIPSGRMFYHPTSGASATVERDEALKHFFLPRRVRDPFQSDAFVTYDGYDLLMTETRDAVGNTITATNEYRVLQPTEVTDPNGNRSVAAFDALGLVVAAAVMGKTAENLGDSLANLRADLTQQESDQFFSDPRGLSAATLLGGATTRIIYDLDRFKRFRQPPFAATITRENHLSDPPSDGIWRFQVSFSYSDGFGREIQKKIQAEPGPVPPGTTRVDPRWVGTGWTTFNNKGKPIRQYEPFFTTTHDFEFAKQVGVSPILFYDPVERVVATLHPNHTYEKVVFDPWQQKTYDVNDTVKQADPQNDPHVGGFFKRLQGAEYLPTWHTLRTGAAVALQKWPDTDPVSGNSLPQNAAIRANERTAAKNSEAHNDTPTTAYLDALGRTVLTIAHNGKDGNGNDVLYPTRVHMDMEGNQREVDDAKLDQVTRQGRIVMQYDYDLLSTLIHQRSMEAPEQWMLNDVLGKPIRIWKNPRRQETDPEQVFETHYDVLRRPVRSFVQGFDAADFTRRILFEQIVYGDDPGNGLTSTQVAAAKLRGKIYQQFDGAGVVTNVKYDFKGNLIESSRQLTDQYKGQVNWQAPPNLTETFLSFTQHDALNRPITVTTPHTPAMSPSIIRPVYNEAGLLNSLSVDLRGAATATDYVTNIDYNEKGQRTKIEYGNSVESTYTYDRETFRLVHLETKRTGSRFTTNERIVQSLTYTYDPVGNITHIRDEADPQNVIYFSNRRVDPSANYLYDAIYRLIAADGREHIGQAAQPETNWDDQYRVKLAHPHDGQAMRQYIERYVYDEVGNIDEVVHALGTLTATGQTVWRRTYEYAEASLVEDGGMSHPLRMNNRLSRTTVRRVIPGQSVPEAYSHDRHGNMTTMPHLPRMEWNFRDQLHHVERGTMKAYYVYDAGGQRVRKVVEKNNGALIEERIYLGGFEIFRQRNGNGLQLERETLHVMDDNQRIALVETRTLDTAGDDQAPQQLIRYQFGNHLGSSTLELDDQAQIISYEEYAPYGSTTYQAVRGQTETAKRYRYTGKERDEESGLYCHVARYFASWLGRWTASDPAPLTDSANGYLFVRDRPIVFHDPRGDRERTPEIMTPPTVTPSLPSAQTTTSDISKLSIAVRSLLIYKLGEWDQDVQRTQKFGRGYLESARKVFTGEADPQALEDAQVALVIVQLLLRTGGGGPSNPTELSVRLSPRGSSAVAPATTAPALDWRAPVGNWLNVFSEPTPEGEPKPSPPNPSEAKPTEPPSQEKTPSTHGQTAEATKPAPAPSSSGASSKPASVWERVVKQFEAIMKTRGSLVGKIEEHHVFPRAFREYFKKAGINVDEYVVPIDREIHKVGQGKGSFYENWNKAWAEWIGKNPNATEQQIFEQGGRMMDEYGLSLGTALKNYRK